MSLSELNVWAKFAWHQNHVHVCMQGVLRMGQEIEVRPGIVTKDAEGRVQCMPIYSRIVSLLAESNVLQYAVPGGLIGVGTTVRSRACLFPVSAPQSRMAKA